MTWRDALTVALVVAAWLGYHAARDWGVLKRRG
jgi:hypothetical protein